MYDGGSFKDQNEPQFFLVAIDTPSILLLSNFKPKNLTSLLSVDVTLRGFGINVIPS